MIEIIDITKTSRRIMMQSIKNGTVKAMKREEYLTQIFNAYSLISVLSTKNDAEVLKLRNKESNNYIVVRSFSKYVPAYEALYNINCKNLPLIYDVINLDDGQIVLE